MLEELDKTKLTNYGNLDTSLLKKRNHSIPIMPMPSLMLGAYWADV
jgi:spermidine/putrescine-binding protein